MNQVLTAGNNLPHFSLWRWSKISKSYFHRSLLFILFAVYSFSQEASAQQNISKTISGIVRNHKGEPLSGVTIGVKGSVTATISDVNGRYTISVPSSNSVLVFSYVGMLPQERRIGDNNTVDISFADVSESLGDVVVVGYGTQKRATLTGAVSTVTAKTFQDRGPVASPLAALQGQVPGVVVTRNSAQPGRENWNFQIRGASSVTGVEPLVIVDGIPVPGLNALNSFNPADIESISFLKDAAASIYGTRAAGGVVLITTKRAKTGKAVIEYNGSVSRKKIGLLPDLVDGRGWGPIMVGGRVADGFLPTDLWYKYGRLYGYATEKNKQIMTQAEAQAALTEMGLDPASFFTDVKDFPFFNGTEQDVLWGDATSTEHQLSISSRGENAGYRLSLGYLNDGSLLQPGNNSNKRYNLRFAHDYNISPKLKLQSNISVEKNDILQPYRLNDILNNGNQPGKPPSGLGATGLPYVWGSGIQNASVNAIANFGGENKELNTRLNTNFNLTYKLMPNLQLVGAAGYYLLNTDYRSQENIINWYDYPGTTNISNLPARSSYQRGNKKEANYAVNAYAEYNKVFGGNHDLKAMVGAQYERYEYNRFISKTLDVLPGAPPSLNNSTGDATSKSVAEDQQHRALAGYFGRLNYAYKGKYLFEANARYDGSSRLAPDDRWKFFHGFLAAWRLSEEEFMKNITFLNDLKLRASWGSTGNSSGSGIGNYDYIRFLNLAFSGGQGSSAFPIIGSAPVVRVSPTNRLPVRDRTWERLEIANIGMDLLLLNRRLGASAEYFVKRNNSLLLGRTLPAVLGADAPIENNGDLKTWGWELSLNWSDQIGSFRYHIGGNISDNQNKLIDFGGQTLIGSGGRGFNSTVQGYPINSYFGLVYAGRIQTEKELADYRTYITGNNIGIPAGGPTAQANGRLALGDNMFKDIDGDGKITFPQDAVFLGTDEPRYSYSFNGGLEWQGFDLNFIFQGVGKRTVIRDGNWRIPLGVIFQAQNKAFVDEWWTPDRTDARLPRLSSTGGINNYNYFPSDWIAEKGAYLRLKNLVIGYTIPRSITQRAKIEKLRFYFSGNDLWEVSHIKDGWDPEASRTVNNGGDPENNNISTFSQRYPFYRYYTFGLNLTF